MPLPLLNGSPITQRGTVYAYRKTANKPIVYGPFSMSRAPVHANVSIGMESGPSIDADEVWFFTTGTNIEFNDTLRRIETNQVWQVVDIKSMSRLIVYVKRIGQAVAGNK